jgi:precorrin-6Y C5,15-methyltransferase (decarboxylating) CbiT subunit
LLAEQARYRDLVPGIPDEAFIRPEAGPEVMTRQEVRSVLLGKIGGLLQPGDSVWDIGAGLGTVSVEIAVLRPAVEVVAVEREPARAAFLRQNRERFGAYNVRVVEGEAPAVLEAEVQRPSLAFIGGSGACLRHLLDLVAERLREGGRLLANFVTLENLAETVQRLGEWSWPHSVTEVHVARSDSLGPHTGLRPLRGVFLVRADRPGANR